MAVQSVRRKKERGGAKVERVAQETKARERGHHARKSKTRGRAERKGAEEVKTVARKHINTGIPERSCAHSLARLMVVMRVACRHLWDPTRAPSPVRRERGGAADPLEVKRKKKEEGGEEGKKKRNERAKKKRKTAKEKEKKKVKPKT